MVCLALVAMKILSKRTLFIIFLIGCASSPVLFYFISKNSTQNSLIMPVVNTTVLPSQEQTSYGLPTRLKIPAINVDAAVEHLGLTSDGSMDVPKKGVNVAWFNLGPQPGENGSAVIAGHYGRWKNGEGSVFDNLNKLRQGDKIYIEDDKGTTLSFVVRESRSYDLNADASDVFYSNDGKSHLNLITCEGVWNAVSKSYSQRLVVFTDKE